MYVWTLLLPVHGLLGYYLRSVRPLFHLYQSLALTSPTHVPTRACVSIPTYGPEHVDLLFSSSITMP